MKVVCIDTNPFHPLTFCAAINIGDTDSMIMTSRALLRNPREKVLPTFTQRLEWEKVASEEDSSQVELDALVYDQ